MGRVSQSKMRRIRNDMDIAFTEMDTEAQRALRSDASSLKRYANARDRIVRLIKAAIPLEDDRTGPIG
jgi:hypothetical protein